MGPILVGLCLSAFLFAILSFIGSVYIFIEVRAMKLSTHQVTMVNSKDNSMEDFDLFNTEETNSDKKKDEREENLYDNIQ